VIATIKEEAVEACAYEQPAHGRLRVSGELKKKGMPASPGGVRGVCPRHGLAAFKARLKALEAKMVRENLVLTESRLAALERAEEEKEAHGEMEAEHPGCLGSAGHLLCREYQRCCTYLPTDLHRHVYEGGVLQAL
jgi:hypothetical protein